MSAKVNPEDGTGPAQSTSGQSADRDPNLSAFEMKQAAAPRADRPIRASRLSSTLALALWKDVTISSVAGDMPDLSARQTAVLMCVYLEDGPHTVRSLAARLNVTKAVISRAIDRLKSYNYILRADDPRDRRSIVLRRTPEGINYLRAFAKIIQREMPDGLTSAPLPAPRR
ncbi:MarR family transcriptional regulator [uncultured Algimonas sp.]|uniref:MarR family transcriptional regulator n=1 Tax=uncultured Algimonas sp. TaxID=1547920 RepID=UPI0026059366|nr:MarR family transcriptional regulator [uncultured Algimonas sp.]